MLKSGTSQHETGCDEMTKWGILAGRGYLPLEVARGMKNSGLDPIILGLAEEVGPFLEEAGFTVTKISVGEIGAIRRFFQKKAVNKLIMAGKVGKEALFSGIELDRDFKLLLSALPVKNDDAILLAVVRYLTEGGITVEPQTRFLRHILAKEGILAGSRPTHQEELDIRFGFRLAKEMGRLDIGQSVVVKNGVILAVEAIEGTDRAIIRGGELGGKGSVVVKVAKPLQDLRFDVPTVGLTTVNSMVSSGARVLAVEAGATFILQQKETAGLAEKHGISVVAIDKNSIIDKGL